MSVQYWEDQYVQKYMANSDGDVYLSQVDSSVLYDGLDSLRIKVAGETTGLHSVEWLRDLEPPDIRYPFKDMVNSFIDQVNATAMAIRDDNIVWNPNSITGIGPTRSFYFLSTEVIRGATADGFHRNEGPMVGKEYIMDGVRFTEYDGFDCANRHFRFFQAPTLPVPYWDGLGPRHVQVGVHQLPEEVRLHVPRVVWPGHRTRQENDDTRTKRVRRGDCLICKTYEVLYAAGSSRARKKNELRAAGIRFPNTFTYNESDAAPRYTTAKATQTDYLQSPKPAGSSFQKSIKSTGASGLLHSTPQPHQGLVRRRSLSVGSSPMTPDLSYSKKSNQDLSINSTKVPANVKKSTKNLFSSAPSVTATTGKENATVGLSSTTAPPIVTASTLEKKGSEKSKNRYSKSLIEVCQEFARQEAEAIAWHEENKREKRYHLCPKLNFDSTDNSDDIQQLTDTSCTSTCACQNEQEDEKDETTLHSSTAGNSDQTKESVTFLHLSDDDEEEAAPAVDVAKSKSPSPMSNPPTKALTTPPASAISKTRGTKRQTRSTGSASTTKTVKYSQEFKPDDFNKIRDSRFPMSPRLRLFRHVQDVNASRAELDISLLPRGATLMYSPRSQSISVEDIPSDMSAAGDCPENATDEDPPTSRKDIKTSESNEIEPGKFYTNPESK